MSYNSSEKEHYTYIAAHSSIRILIFFFSILVFAFSVLLFKSSIPVFTFRI